MTQEPRDLIVALNLYMLDTISKMARESIQDAMLRFNINENLAKALADLNVAEIFEISRAPTFLFCVNQNNISTALEDRKNGSGYNSIHKSIVEISSMMEHVDRGDKDA